jgi:hypothetical protein
MVWRGQRRLKKQCVTSGSTQSEHSKALLTVPSGVSLTAGLIRLLSATSCRGSYEKTPGESERRSDRREHVAPRQRMLRSDRHSDKFGSTRRTRQLVLGGPLHALSAQAAHVASMTGGGLKSNPKAIDDLVRGGGGGGGGSMLVGEDSDLCEKRL